MAAIAYLFFLALTFSNISCHSHKKPEEEKFKGLKFCRNERRLIRLERIGDILVVDVVRGSDILLECKFCEEKDLREPRIWYTQNVSTGSSSVLRFDESNKPKRTRVHETSWHSLVIKNISDADIGLYLCRLPYEDALDTSFNYLIDVIPEGPPDTGDLIKWRNYSENYLLPKNSKLADHLFTYEELKVEIKYEIFSWFAPWTKCDTCVKSPKRRQTAHCRVKPVCLKNVCSEKALESGLQKMQLSQLLLYTSTSLPCRGHILRAYLPHIADIVDMIPDFSQEQGCTAYCPAKGDDRGPVGRRTVNLLEGRNMTVICPGYQGNRKIVWKYKKMILDPLEEHIDGHVMVDYFGVLHLSNAFPKMQGKYMCLDKDEVILELLITVTRTSSIFGKSFQRHLLYLLTVTFVCFLFFCMVQIVRFCRRKRFGKSIEIIDGFDAKPLLDSDDEEEEFDSSLTDYYDNRIYEDEEMSDDNDIELSEIMSSNSLGYSGETKSENSLP